MMTSKRIQRQSVSIAGVLILGVAVASPVLNAAAAVWLMTFTIDQGYQVSGDGLDPLTDGTAVYKDYRLGTGRPDDVNYCVEASPTPTLLFIRLNRKLDGDSGTQYCGRYDGSPRQFSVEIYDQAACNELSSHGYGSYVDPQGQTQTTGPDAPCIFTGAEKPRIRISSDLYAKRTTTTPVAFLSKWYDVYRTSYELQTETDATVVKVGFDPSMRIVRYTGFAKLVRFEADVTESEVPQPFWLSFQMTFTRTAQ